MKLRKNTRPTAAAAAPATNGAQEASGADDGRILSSSALDAAVAGHESSADRERARLAELLSRPQVRDLARDRGIGMARVEAAAASLGDGDLAEVAPIVAKARAVLQQGGTITISAVAVVVILLLLIILLR